MLRALRLFKAGQKKKKVGLRTSALVQIYARERKSERETRGWGRGGGEGKVAIGFASEVAK